ncbi:UNVERIFIED_CONTAM: Anoctamin-3 [Siphonaria sp. JEL0065]|nr:Anoctamin-3 [Siphonaria sp. JEL0065]
MLRQRTKISPDRKGSTDTVILASVVGRSEVSLVPSMASTVDNNARQPVSSTKYVTRRKATIVPTATNTVVVVETPSITVHVPDIAEELPLPPTVTIDVTSSLPAFQSTENLNKHLNPSHANSRSVSIMSDKTDSTNRSRHASMVSTMSASSAMANMRNSTAVPRSSIMLPLASHRPSMSSYDDQYVLDLAEATRLPQYYRDDKLNAFGGIRDEYATKIIQFGYIALFACSFPLAPLFALINNIYEIRADAFKLLVVYQRPEPFLAQDIGVWGIIIRVIAITSVTTNSVLVSFTSPTFDTFFANGLSSGEQLAVRLGFVIIFHYCVFALTQLFQLLMPSTPNMVATAMARAQYLEKVKMDQDLEEEDEFFNLESRESLC